jgi:site-specific DNA-methyltransferase (adenine-specific)
MLDWLADYDGPLFDSCITDPPYHLASIVRRFGGAKADKEKFAAQNPTKAYASLSRGFMGKEWDGGDIAFRPETWAAVYAALKPGAHLVAFSGTRTYHRMACAIEDAGFEIRDQLAWTYGSGFPKSHDVSKAIDKAAGADGERVAVSAPVKRMIPGADQAKDGLEKADGREFVPHEYRPATPDAQKWQGWGTALKPAWEPICLARKPLAEKSVAANVLAHGTGAINVDGCRVESGADYHELDVTQGLGMHSTSYNPRKQSQKFKPSTGRFPANLCHDGSDDVLMGFPETASGSIAPHHKRTTSKTANTFGERAVLPEETHGDSGSAARFFYSAKAGPLDRIGTAHATVKPVDLMRWLCRLITPPGGHILEPFAGSGTTGIAAMAEGFDCTMIELLADHATDIERKLAFLRGEGGVGVMERHKARIDRAAGKAGGDGPLFGDAA